MPAPKLAEPSAGVRRRSKPPLLFGADQIPKNTTLDTPAGLFGRGNIKAMVNRGLIRSDPGILESQFQPASLDVRVSREAYRLRASFLPGKGSKVRDRLKSLNAERISLAGHGAVLEKGIVYIARIVETLDLSPSIAGAATPKSSTGRLDIFTRLIADESEAFDRVPANYAGELWLEISPRSFSVRVREGSRLSQIRFRRLRPAQQSRYNFAVSDSKLRLVHAKHPLVDRDADIREGLVLRVSLGDGENIVVGYRAIKNSDVIDIEKMAFYRAEDFWEPIHGRPDRRLILDPDEFYILASKEKVQIPSAYAAEMAPIDPAIGEFRVHYAGFFDPGFGMGKNGAPSARAVLEVRSRDVPFLLEDGQPVGRLLYEQLVGETEELYGASLSSNYQGQGLRLSKHFREFPAG
jgi:dCTP deaminase